MKHNIHKVKVGIVCIMLLASMGTQAVINTNYGNFEASTVWYNQVSEMTDEGKYGAPNISTGSDAMTFTPLGLVAESAGGGSTVNTAMITVDVQSKPTKSIDGFYFYELGLYTLEGTGTDATLADVSAEFTLTVTEVDHSPYTLAPVDFSMTFSPNPDGTFEFAGSNEQDSWNGQATIFLDSILDAQLGSGNYISGATGVTLELKNILTAQSEAGTSALIQKTFDGGLTYTVDVIPEPASAVLLVGAASLLTFIRRKFIG